MMVRIIRENIAARSKWSPTNACRFQFKDNCCSLLFRCWRYNPVDRSAYAETGKFGKTFAAFSSHSESVNDLLQRFITSQ